MTGLTVRNRHLWADCPSHRLHRVENRRLVWIVIGVIAILVAGTALAVWAFSADDETPGSGTGETITLPR